MTVWVIPYAWQLNGCSHCSGCYQAFVFRASGYST
jgi:hypothetical protein